MERDAASPLPLPTLQRVRAWITNGVSLDILTPPANVDHANTPTVDSQADVVLQRIAEYTAFGAIVPLPANHPTPFGVQRLHMIVKEGASPASSSICPATSTPT